MPRRTPSDWPRLSGRPDAAAPPADHANQRVFRRFFELIERLERPRAAPAAKSGQTGGSTAPKGRR